MKNNPVFLSILLLTINLSLLGQSTYSLFLEDSLSKLPFRACESSDNKINVIIAEKTGPDYGPHELIRGYMIIFDSIGDTIIKNYSFGDTIFSFDCIQEVENGFIIAGMFKSPGDSIYGLMICKLDMNRDLIWSNFIRNTTYSRYFIEDIFYVNNQYFLCGAAYIGHASFANPYLIKLDNNGHQINENIYGATGSESFRYLLTQDSSYILLLTSSGLSPINGPSITFFDLDLNFIKIEQFFSGFLSRLSCKWYTPDAFLITSVNDRPDAEMDADIFLYKIDTNYNVLNWNNFGSPDTADVTTMMSQSIDFENLDSIYFGGYKNRTIGIPWPGETDWIMIGQTDSTFQPRFVNYIGGDAYYETNYILATKDGGVFVCAGKFSHEKRLYDLLFLKLNNEGVLVNNKSPNLKILKSNVSPNPASDLINIESWEKVKKIEIYDLDGRIVHTVLCKNFPISVDISSLKPSLYFVRVLYEDGKIETHKLIKV